MSVEVDKLTKYGLSYQSKIIYCLITDLDFLETVDDILLPDYFESEPHQWVVEIILEYFNTYKTNPTLDVFKVKLENENNEGMRNERFLKLKEAFEHKNSTDLPSIKKDFIEFCVNQHYKIALYESIDDMKDGKYDSIKKRFDDASKVGQNKNIGLKLLDHSVDDIFLHIKRNTIPTPWDIINEITEGGSGDGETGELFIVVSGPGGGKSWTLADVGASALKIGYNVVHYSCELSETMVARRYYSRFTGIPSMDLQYSKDEIQHKIDVLNKKNGKLVIKGYPPESATMNTLRAHLTQCVKLGIKPDLVIVDYGDLLKPMKFHREKRLEISNIFVQLRGLSGEYRVPIWTASQANRSSAESEYIAGEQISEDYSKIMIGDFIMSLSRKVDDAKNKTARIFTIKNRFGPDKLIYPSKFDVSNGNLFIFEPQSIQGQDTNKQMQDNKGNTKSLLREKILQIDSKKDKR